jgi:hypothetical protein
VKHLYGQARAGSFGNTARVIIRGDCSWPIFAMLHPSAVVSCRACSAEPVLFPLQAAISLRHSAYAHQFSAQLRLYVARAYIRVVTDC